LADIVSTEAEKTLHNLDDSISEEQSADIVISDLHFKYGEYEPMVLKGIDLSIKAGESVAIVGGSGCGKTTLMHVMLGLLEPKKGTVTVGGINTRDAGAQSLRRIVGAVTQDDTLLAGSMADNISFFDPQADRAWIEQCAKVAAIHEEIMVMPMAYETLVGDMGSVLSGGQKQRVLLARALYRKPKILLLDEATSHLDIERERRVSDAIKGLNVTRVIIAHRPETIASAQRVIQIVDGRVVHQSKPIAPEPLVAIAAVVPVVPVVEEQDLVLAVGSLPPAPAILRIS
jgi:ATP-binding cassette, subfamily B, bacterial CvaB/MchF/RaxB